MKNYLFITLAIVLLLSTQVMGQSEEKGWVKLAERTASYKPETDKVNMMGKEQDVSKIKLTCTQGTLKIKKIRVEMSDGTKKEYDPKGTGVLSKGMSSLTYDLPGKDLKLKEIEIDYDSMGNMVVTKRAKVEIWGKTTD